MNRSAQLASVLVLGVCLVAGTGAGVEITDDDEIANATWGAYDGEHPYENDEVSHGCVTGQAWDLEGMFLYNGQLTLTGGFNFADGAPDSRGTNGAFRSGDVFISVGDAPYYGEGSHAFPEQPPEGWTDPDGDDDYGWGDYASDYNYDYVIDIDWGSDTSGNTTSPSWVAYDVDGGHTTVSTTEGVFFDQNDAANPYRLISTTGDTEASGTGSVTGTTNNWAAAFDISWLDVDNGVDVYFHFTQECGNDVVMGFTNEFETQSVPVPEPASVGLLGMGILGLMATRIRRKRF